ncbi:MAG TPA: PRC-barrel domain-containing protein [Vicinamibacterales bacterium]|nr:PRC-barrel domain-containing protein [Vicinamibacterales bacterium]
MDHPLPWLRYVDASDVAASEIEFDGMKVRNDAMETLGKVDGFIVDNSSMRPYYVVVDSGGWFKSKDFLVPIGHAHLDGDRDALVVDIAKERIERFPGFDRDEFERLTESDIRRMNDSICEACSDTPGNYAPTDPLANAWGRPDYRQPDWWASVSPSYGVGADLSPADSGFIPTADYPATKVGRALDEVQVEPMIEREAARPRTPQVSREAAPDRELVTARESDTSPHFDGRAQPGDVLGLETGGEETHIGDTAADEDKRRLAAEKDAAKDLGKRRD